MFQAEQLAILEALRWSEKTTHNHIRINSGSQSTLQAIEDIDTHDTLIAQIIKHLQQTNKNICFKWVKSHIGISGNERADHLAKEAVTSKLITEENWYPAPASFLKWTLKNRYVQRWQKLWDEEYRGRKAYDLFPNISLDTLLPHRNLYLFITNHGPFPTYLSLFNKAPSPYCTCGELGDSLHYIRKCPLTAHYHIKKQTNIKLSSWFAFVLKSSILTKRIIDCVGLLELNQGLFQMPPAHLVGLANLPDEEDIY